jgi:hypothetical protein
MMYLGETHPLNPVTMGKAFSSKRKRLYSVDVTINGDYVSFNTDIDELDDVLCNLLQGVYGDTNEESIIITTKSNI